jgi:hypothetical protein
VWEGVVELPGVVVASGRPVLHEWSWARHERTLFLQILARTRPNESIFLMDMLCNIDVVFLVTLTRLALVCVYEMTPAGS